MSTHTSNSRPARPASSAPPWHVPARYNIAADVCDRQEPDRLAMIWQDWRGRRRTLRWAEMQTLAAQFAYLLTRRGLASGDRVTIVLPPLPETAAAALGTLKAGGIVVMLSALWGPEAIAYRLGDCTPTVVITDADSNLRVQQAITASNTAAELVVLTDDLLTGLPAQFCTVDTAADDPAQICYTSGTTGNPKGIVHAHRMLLGHNEFDICHDLQPDELYHGAGDWAWSLVKVLGPWRHRATQFVYHQGPRFDPVALFDALAEHHVSNLMLNPTVVRKLRDVCPDARQRYRWQPRIACCSSEPLPAELVTWFAEQFNVTLLDFYGGTESYPLISNRPDQPVKPGSMGTATPGWNVMLLTSDDQPSPVEEPGEICLRARSNPQYPLGYWNRPQASAETFGGEWFHTRDTATVDADGYFWYVGRNDDVIISSGYRIGPHEFQCPFRDVAQTGKMGWWVARRRRRFLEP